MDKSVFRKTIVFQNRLISQYRTISTERIVHMNARNKLNSIYALSILVSACVIGLVTGSWFLSGLLMVALAWLCLANGEIRFPTRRD